MPLFRLKSWLKSIFVLNKGKYTSLYIKCFKNDFRAPESIDKKKPDIRLYVLSAQLKIIKMGKRIITISTINKVIGVYLLYSYLTVNTSIISAFSASHFSGVPA